MGRGSEELGNHVGVFVGGGDILVLGAFLGCEVLVIGYKGDMLADGIEVSGFGVLG